MTAHVETYIECNRPTLPGRYCGQRFPELGPYDYSVEQLRLLARAVGWVSTGINDYCREHAIQHLEGAAA